VPLRISLKRRKLEACVFSSQGKIQGTLCISAFVDLPTSMLMSIQVGVHPRSAALPIALSLVQAKAIGIGPLDLANTYRSIEEIHASGQTGSKLIPVRSDR